MNRFQLIYTEKAQCQDCYRCVRNCSEKAIKIENGVASVVDELCIYCGRCVKSCPAGAKRVRNDRPVVQMLIESGKKVIASLAPSYISEFEGIEYRKLINAIKSLGFYGVSETALGAQEVSSHAALLINSAEPRTWISSACPTVVEIIRKYNPELVPKITPMLSPLLTHCKLLKNSFGSDVHIVFFGPCIAKKKEAFEHPDLLDAALTFDDLRHMINESGIKLESIEPVSSDIFIPQSAQEGALYPVDGGMIACMKKNCTVNDECVMHFSGMEEVCSVLDSVRDTVRESPLFLELLACAGGCVNGPMSKNDNGTLIKRMSILKHTDTSISILPRQPSININKQFNSSEIQMHSFSDDAILEILRQTGKYSRSDELNCSGCGYANCRQFANAVLAGKAETVMCVSYMRQLANKKANKLIMAMPSGVVIVDKNLKIIECNIRFASLAGEETVQIFKETGLTGAVLEKTLPISHLFAHVLAGDEEIIGKDIRIMDRVVRCSVFSIEPKAIVGGVFSDVTAPELKRDEIIKRARSVIRKNLTTVQKIAFLLGENASETEMVLSTIIDSFKADNIDGRQHDSY